MSNDLDIKSQKIYGSLDPIDGNFSLAYEFEPEDSNTLSLRGRFYMVFSMESSAGVDLQLASKLFVDTVKEHYYGDLDGTPLQSLETSLNTGREKLIEIVSSASAIPIKFDVVCCIVWGNILYVAQFGKTSAIIVRGGEYTDISHKTSGDIMTSSGILENEDVVILASKAFEDEFLNSSLIQNLSTLETLFASSPNKALLASVIIRFKKNAFITKKSFSNLVSKLKLNEIKKPLNSNLKNLSPAFLDEKSIANDNQSVLPKISSLTENLPDAVLAPSLDSNAEVKSAKKGRKKKKLLLASLVFVFLTSIISFSIFNSSAFISKIFQNQTDVLVTKVESNREKFNSLIASNAVKEDYIRLLNEIDKGSENELFIEIENYIKSSFEKDNVPPENILYDFSKTDKNISLNSFDISQSSVLLLDSSNKNSYLLDISDTQNVLVKNLALNGDYKSVLFQNSYFYFFSFDKLLKGSNFDNLKESPLEINNLNIDLNFLQAISYGTNFYLLNSKSVVKIDNNNKASIWVSNLENAISFSIDSNIFVNNNGKIEKYYKGEKVDFSISNNLKIDKESLIYTNVDDLNLYVLTTGVLYVVDKKTGDVVKEQNINIPSVRSFKVISDTIFAINKNSIFKIELK